MSELSGARASLQWGLVDRLGSRIARGEIPAGATIAPEQLEQEFGVSRSVVREAFRTLEARGMIRARPRVGTVVRPSADWRLLEPDVIRWRDSGPQSRGQLRELTILREAVEPTSAKLAAANATQSELDTLDAMCQAMEEAAARRDPAAFASADADFHRTLTEASRIEVLKQLLTTIEATLHSRYSSGFPVFSDATDVSLVRHREIVAALRARDGSRAAEITRALILESRDELFNPGAGA